MNFRSKIYEGRVFHQRYRPRKHRLSYQVFSLMIDLDELPEIDRRLGLFGYNRANILSFWDKDHGDGSGNPLRPQIEARLAQAGIAVPGGSITLLCYPRLFGYVFNPLSVYYCRDPEGRMRAVVYEVRNTFGQQHCYVMEVTDPDAKTVRQRCDKNFYVSPFIEMDGAYDFHLTHPGEKLSLAIHHSDGDGLLLKAVFSGRARSLNNRSIGTVLVKYPLMTLKVILGIHWEALKLWRKGLRLVPRPTQPESET